MSGLRTSGANTTVWTERDDLLQAGPTYPKLTTDAESDVLVVGGGIAGLQIAYELLKKGKKVILVEDGTIGSGETGRTTGQLSADNEYNEFLKLHGKEMTAEIAAAQQIAIDRIESIASTHSISCDFARVNGYMFQGLPKSHPDYDGGILQEIYDAAYDTGKVDIAFVDDARIPGFDSGKAIQWRQQGSFHPTKYVKGLVKVIKHMGGEVYEKTRYMSHEENGKGGRNVEVQTADGQTVRVDQLVMATNVPLQKLVVIDRLEPYRTYAMAFSIPTSSISTSNAPEDQNALWWDTDDPYHYIRVTPSKKEGYSLLIVGGEDEKVGQHDDADDRYKRLERWTRARWSAVEGVEYRWSGQVIDSHDGIAHIGLNPGTKNVYIHSGDNGDGLTYAAIGGILLPELITGNTTHPWGHLFSPSRQHSPSHIGRALKTIPDYLKENLSDQVYYAKWIATATKTITDIEDLVPGSGDVVRDGIHPIAVYKDEGGKLCKFTAVCPHLKAIVQWNEDEKSFDCPVHGSRFTCTGKLVNGPAKIDLAPRD